MSGHHGGFLRHLLHAAPVMLTVSVVVFLLGHAGLLRTFETASLDTWLRLKAPEPVRDVVVVGITECDYREIFGSASPLAAAGVGQILDAIVAGRPRAVGVDLDTSHPQFSALAARLDPVPVVWARGASADEAAPCEPAANSSPGQRGLVASGILGTAGVPAGARSGIALLPQDPDGVVRRHRRVFRTTEGALASFPGALVALDRPEHGEEAEDLVLNFAGNRYVFPRYSARDVLAGARGEAWGERGPLKGRIVLLGGLYRAARDEYLTPVGPMSGVDLVGHAIESDLSGAGIRGTNEALMILVEILGGVLMVFVYHRFALGKALLLSLLGIPILALGSSYVSFSSVGRWASFVPLLVAVLLHQLHHHAMEYRRLYLASLRPHAEPAGEAEPA